MDPTKNNDPSPLSTHWEDLVHKEILEEKAINGIIALTNESAGLAMEINTMTGDVTITQTTITNIEKVNTVLKFHADAVAGWVVKR